ncbi:protein of unknown function [Tepidibacter aestuarii]|nr:protein of unknown function [Tepidibacter aestuarii]
MWININSVMVSKKFKLKVLQRRIFYILNITFLESNKNRKKYFLHIL